MDDSKKDEALEQEIRRQRKFSLADAIGREAGGALSGASPVPRADQVLLDVGLMLEVSLPDVPGSLIRTILVNLELDPPLLARHFERPVGALEEYLERTLGSASAVDTLVRDTDARWGRENSERPYFETGNEEPDPDDPYTRSGVRALLEDLLDTLRAEGST